MKKVINDVETQKDSAPNHEAGGEVGAHHFLFHIGVRPAGFVPKSQLNGEENMKENGHEKKDSRPPQNSRRMFEKLGVVVQFLRALENLQVSEQMSDDKSEKNEPRQGHNHFFPNGGLEKGHRWFNSNSKALLQCVRRP